MLKAKLLLDQMTKHFSDWLIVRRNPTQSVGGNIMLGIAQEIESLNTAIEAYTSHFFINNACMKTHEIDSFFMRIHVGEIDISQIQILNPAANACVCMKTFTESFNCSFYEEGYLYFKAALVSEGDRITYRIADTLLTEIAERVEAWNIFDEFALYVGIERMFRETNEHLLDRILYQSQNPVNSSRDGLKNAIANIIDMPPEEITIEKIDENNCYQNDFTGKTLFEQLQTINRDVYRFKRWGVDYWHHQVDHMHYIPHTYDVAPAFYQDGIGDNDDLKVDVTRENEMIHMEVTTYEKSEAMITEYHQKYPTETEVLLKLHKPEGTITPVHITGQIEAGTLTDVTDLDLEMTYIASRSVHETLYPEACIDTSSLTATQTVRFIEGHHYAFRIKPETDYAPLHAKLFINNESFIQSQGDFEVDAKGYLTHDNTKHYIDQLSFFSKHTDFSHEYNGFRLAPQTTTGHLVLPLLHMNNYEMHYTITMADFDAIPDRDITYQNFTKDMDTLSYASTPHSDSFFSIRCDANQVRFYIEGSAIVMTKSALGESEYAIEDAYFETPLQTDKPIDQSFYIIPTDTTQVIKIKDMGYNAFEVQQSLRYGELVNQCLPDYDENTLTLSVTTYTSSSPTIGFIYIGHKMTDVVYTTKEFLYSNQPITFYSRGNAVFECIDLTTDEATFYHNNAPIYTSAIAQEILIQTDAFSKINYLVAQEGGDVIMRDEQYYLRLSANESFSTLLIKGEIIDLEMHYTLDTLVDKKEGLRYYVSPIVEGFIEASDHSIVIKQPTFAHLYGQYYITQLSALYVPVFQSHELVAESHSASAPITSFYIKRVNTKTYKAINTFTTVESYKKDIAFNKNFSPLLPYNEILFYKIESLTAKSALYFYDKQKEALHGTDFESPYSIDLKTINLYADYDLIDSLSSHYQEVRLQTYLDKHIPLPEHISNLAGDTFNLSEFIITPEDGVSVEYEIPMAENIANNPFLLQTESFVLGSNGVKKLKCCNVYAITYISFKPYEENAVAEEIDYVLFAQSGLIQFDDYFTSLHAGEVLYVHYTIKKPILLKLSLDKLYDVIDVSYEAYEKTATEYHNAPVGKYSITSPYFSKADYVTIAISEPGYIATPTIETQTIDIIESMPRDRIVVQKGYYYIEDKEYYLYGAGNDSFEDYQNNTIETIHPNYVEKGIAFYRETENYLKNSAFKTRERALTFSTDFSELETNNYFLRLNACEQVNLWQSFNMALSLRGGLHGQGIHFAPVVKDKYAFMGIPITQKEKDLTLSFWLSGDAVPLIYEQEKWQDEIHLSLTKPKQARYFEQNGMIRTIDLPYDPGIFYYLVLTGEGIIDDMVLCEHIIYDSACHIKNSQKVFMPYFPSEVSPYQRFIFHHQKGFTGTAQMDQHGDILPISNMSYGYTQLLSNDWMQQAILHEATYDNHCILPHTNESYVMTPVVHIPNKEHIEHLIIRSNYLHENEAPFIVYAGPTANNLRSVAEALSGEIILEATDSYLQVRCTAQTILYSLDISARYKEGAIPISHTSHVFESEYFNLGKVGDYCLTNLVFEQYDQSLVYVRYGKTNHLMSAYQLLDLNACGALQTTCALNNTQFIQFKIILNDSCNLHYFDIEEVRE